MKNKIFAILTALSLSLTACAQSTVSSVPEAGSPSSQPASSAESSAASQESAPAEASSQETAQPTEKLDVKVAALKGPLAIGMVKLMDDAQQGTAPDNYSFTLAGSPDELVGGIVKGDFDIATVPTNLASTLYSKTGGKVKLAALNTMGVLYLLEAGDSIQSVADLKGKTIYATAKGSTPEFALNYILAQNGLTVGTDVTVEYLAEHTELSSMLATGKADIALLPEPFVSTTLMQNDKLRVALDLTKEWDTATKGTSGLTMSGVLVQQSFIDEHPDAVKRFLNSYRASVVYVTDSANLDAAAQLVVAQGIIAKLEAAKKAIPRCGIVFKDGDEMKTAVSGFLQVLFEANPQSVGGKLPDENFYYYAQS